MAFPLTLIPCRSLDFDQENDSMTLTPEVKKNFSQLFDDEDSGIGMDDHMSDLFSPLVPTRLDFSNVFGGRETPMKTAGHPDLAIKRSFFSSAKRQRDADDEGCLIPSAKSRRKDNSVVRKTLSFENIPETSAEDVKIAVNRLAEETDLVGDGTDTFCLPTTRGKHQDLKSISSQTMSDILTGKYDDAIQGYRIIDCRYPYEYDGGHIKGAENMYTRDQIQQLLQEGPLSAIDGKRHILIFHCEFSSERGPKMMRFLRSQDRAQNEASYPALSFPEIYLLDAGYKEFFHTDKTLCTPMEYTPMLQEEHSDDLRHFRLKSKSWTAGQKKKRFCRRHI